jgi:polysaccharide pyruvyl transferase WcaK-like protein
VTGPGPTKRRPPVAAVGVGLFGLLGAGNIGNDASMEVVLRYLRADHPDVLIDAMCPGTERLRHEYGIEASQMWHRQYEAGSGLVGIARRLVGKGVDGFGIASWVRRHDVVIVPGMGVLEASLPMRPWETPFAMFMLGISGKLFRTKVVLVSVGANPINQRLTRWLLTSAARLAFYRSYRDSGAREAMRRRGLDVTRDRVYPDLVFGLPLRADDPGDAQSVGVGVMAYYGGNDDRAQAQDIYASYVRNMILFVRWLVESGRSVRLLVGDASDYTVVQEILADIRGRWPDLDPGRVVAESVESFAELARAIAPVGTVVATRYHNVMCALKLSKPTISIGYSTKNIALMADMGMSEFCQDAKSLDVELLIKQFNELQERSAQLKPQIAERCQAQAFRLSQQLAELSAVLFPAAEAVHSAAKNEPIAESSRL